MALLEVLLPPACAGCGRYGAVICIACRAELRPALRAGDQFLAPDSGVVVGSVMTIAVAAFTHRDASQRILRRLKYGGGRKLASPLAECAMPAFRRLMRISGPAVLVPVPLHAARRTERGYNQAELLAVELGRRGGAEVWPVLARSRATHRQHELNRSMRLSNLRAAMAVRGVPPPGGPLGARAVVIVDDILTTGATLEACADVLHGAGIGAIYGFAIAREV